MRAYSVLALFLLLIATSTQALACGWFIRCPEDSADDNQGGWGRRGNQMASAKVSPDKQLVNAVHNYENLSLDDRLKIVSSLLKDPKAKVNPNSLNELGEPILGDAVHFGDGKHDDIRVVKALVEAGANVNAVSAKTHRSPLTKAAEFGKIEVIRYFFEHGLEINNENGTRALVKAAFMNFKQIVELFLDKGFVATGQYAESLTAPGMKSEETKATAALFGAYVDIAKDELFSLIRTYNSSPRDQMLADQLSKIFTVCKEMHAADAIEGNMFDYFNRSEECSDMGRLGSLAYMHCYGLIRSNSANLKHLQEQITAAAAQFRSALQFEKVAFARVENPQELLGYDSNIRASMLVYTDLLMPRMRLIAARMGHHAKRNNQLQQQAQRCQNRVLLAGANGISASIAVVANEQAQQLASFQAEFSQLEKMRAKIAFQLPALNATEVLKKHEAEEARIKAEEERKKREEETKAKRGGRSWWQ